jgi:hypothetical protein
VIPQIPSTVPALPTPSATTSKMRTCTSAIALMPTNPPQLGSVLGHTVTIATTRTLAIMRNSLHALITSVNATIPKCTKSRGIYVDRRSEALVPRLLDRNVFRTRCARHLIILGGRRGVLVRMDMWRPRVGNVVLA